MKFKTIKPLKEVGKEKKKLKLTLLLFKFSVIFCLLTLSIYGGFMFYDTHDFRSPLIFQNPVPVKEIKIESPIGSKSASLIHKAEAEEITNPYNPESPKGVAWEINKNLFGVEHWDSWELLGFKESGWNPYAVNKSSGACGIAQALPCSKMNCELWDYQCQINWMGNYIADRYGNPTKALSFHFEHNYY